MDSKSQKDLTKIEIDAYNKLISELNKEVGVYNKLNAKFNSERSIAIDNWNQAGEYFINKHVPID